eukprot:COSAG05_NODE_5831_length_1078_cov_1.360572_1_plen_56_part_00
MDNLDRLGKYGQAVSGHTLFFFAVFLGMFRARLFALNSFYLLPMSLINVNESDSD